MKNETIICRSVQHSSILLLGAFWIAGLLFGASAALLAADQLPLFMRSMYAYPATISGIAMRILLPLLLLLIPPFLSQMWLRFPLALIHAFLLAYWTEAILLSWAGVAGWLFCLIFFYNFLSSCIFLWVSARNVSSFQCS